METKNIILGFKEHYYLNSILRHEKLFGPKSFRIVNKIPVSKRIKFLLDKEYVFLKNDKIYVSDLGKLYLNENKGLYKY